MTHERMHPHQLRVWRLLRQMTQADAAEWAGVSERSWRRYETTQVPSWLARQITREEARCETD
jgi:DNA-binding XRE family transcriptional regulator